MLQQCGSAVRVTAAGSNASGVTRLVRCNAFRCNCRTADLCTAGRSGALQHAVLCAASCTMTAVQHGCKMVQGGARCCKMVHLWTAAGSRESTLTGDVGLVRLSAPLVITSPIEYAYPNCDHLLPP